MLFLFLFRQTDYPGGDTLPYAVNIFFRWDPLVAAAATLAAKAFIALVLPALIIVALTLVFGRFFCGWICPLGTCLDMAHKVIRPRSDKIDSRYSSIKYYLLIAVLITALFGLPLVGFLDPFSILVRGLTVSVDPGLTAAVGFPFDIAYNHGPGWLTGITEPVYDFLRGTILPFNQNVYTLAVTNFAILAFVFLLEFSRRRFWCRELCPLGGMLALIGRIAPLRMHPGKACHADGCAVCSDICRMGAIDEEGSVSPEDCNLCLDCMEKCPNGIISFKFRRPRHEPAPVSITRRGVMGAVAGSLIVPAVFKARAIVKRKNPKLIRPPGAREEEEFMARCVKCAECMKVCIGNAIHPAMLQSGPEGMFSPVIIPRIGFCEYNCTLCGQVCPTGAIRELTRDEKHKTKIGLARVDRDMCLPWKKGIPCIVCEEMCPVPHKAIKLREEKAITSEGNEVTVQRPYVVDELCIGCGICETKCPVPGRAAIRVTAEGESRSPGGFLTPLN